MNPIMLGSIPANHPNALVAQWQSSGPVNRRSQVRSHARGTSFWSASPPAKTPDSDSGERRAARRRTSIYSGLRQCAAGPLKPAYNGAAPLPVAIKTLSTTG